MNLLIHHHALAYFDKNGYWFPSFIGSWLDEICNQFSSVTYIGELSSSRYPHQDFYLKKDNFNVLCFGIRGIQTSAQKRKTIKAMGEKYSPLFSCLIIRGITPWQYQIFKSFINLPCFFLMVGSLIDSKPKINFSYSSIIIYLFYLLRTFQLYKISRKAVVLVNSPQITNEFKSILKVDAEFVPTNTLKNAHFNHFIFRGFRNIPVLLFCGRVVKDKGIEELIKAVGVLKIAGIVCQLIVIGSIVPDYRSSLENLIKSKNVSSNVIFKGFVEFGDDLLSLYRFSDIYILPSYHEGFPHSIWEASCSSTPIITTRVGGIPGLVTDNEVFFTEVKSVKSLAKSIQYILSNPELAKSKALSAYCLAKKYSIENCIQIFKSRIQHHLSN